MNRVQEIDALVAEQYDRLHETIMANGTGYGVFGAVDEIVERIAELKVERARWATRQAKSLAVADTIGA